ncbi:MAG TPA: S41 family peptidase [Allosphingosinicella sp.]|jgi:hypothetical protein
MAFLTAALLASAVIQAAPAPVQETLAPADWRRIAQGDIAAAYDIYLSSHPGVVDPTNPSFPAQLKRARDKAMAFANQVEDEAGYRRALAVFSAEMQDGHAQLWPVGKAAAATLEWPGFVSAWRGDRLFVHRSEGSAIPRGSVIHSCDGRNAKALLNKYEFSWRGRPAEAGQWWSHGTHLFLREPSKYLRPIKSCRFRTPSGRIVSKKLQWTPAPPEAASWAAVAMEGEPSTIGFSEPRPGLFLISMPTFSPDKAGTEAYTALFAAVDEHRERITTARAVVIDLRHNKGGSSSYSRKLATQLWGKPSVDAAAGNLFKDVEIWWRASPDNARRHRNVAASLRRSNLEDRAVATDRMAEKIEGALARKETFHVDSLKKAEVPVPPPLPLPPVYVITDGSCFSACLDAVDIFKRFSNVKLIGAPTSADSPYMETVGEKLPSGRAQAAIPTKIWMGKPRKNGEYYSPDLLFTALDWTLSGSLDAVERDLRPAQLSR